MGRADDQIDARRFRFRVPIASAGLVGLALLVAAALAPGGAAASTKWLCKPGVKPNPCKGSLETTFYDGAGDPVVRTAANARRPTTDCFYVYPTVSEQPTVNADKRIDPQQTAIAEYQAARYSQTCRVYAPVYRQVTLAGIGNRDELDPAAYERAYADVLEAWRTYLRKFNRGRGFVLLGHSQGTGMLNELLRTEIEKRRAQHRRLVSAILLGGNVTVEKGSDTGGTFRRTPTCSSARQTGCVIAFSTFNDTPPANALFGRTDGPFAVVPRGADPADYEVACTNPAALGGGTGEMRTLSRGEPFPGILGIGISIMYGGPPPTAETPWLSPRDSYAGECERGNGANALMLTPIDGSAELNPSPDPTWGLHLLDANVALGNLVRIVARQAERYARADR